MLRKKIIKEGRYSGAHSDGALTIKHSLVYRHPELQAVDGTRMSYCPDISRILYTHIFFVKLVTFFNRKGEDTK